MNYHLKIEKAVIKSLSKLPKNQSDYIFSRLNELKKNYVGYDLLRSNSNKQLWELRCAHHRIYYLVTHGQVTVLNAVYDGTIRGLSIGNKNTQVADIKSLSKEHLF